MINAVRRSGLADHEACHRKQVLRGAQATTAPFPPRRDRRRRPRTHLGIWCPGRTRRTIQDYSHRSTAGAGRLTQIHSRPAQPRCEIQRSALWALFGAHPLLSKTGFDLRGEWRVAGLLGQPQGHIQIPHASILLVVRAVGLSERILRLSIVRLLLSFLDGGV